MGNLVVPGQMDETSTSEGRLNPFNIARISGMEHRKLLGEEGQTAALEAQAESWTRYVAAVGDVMTEAKGETS